MKIGDLLLLKGVINKKQLQAALRKQSEEAINYDRSVPLGKILIEKKYVTVDEIADALNEQTKEIKEEKEEKRVMPTEIGEGSKFTFDLKFIATIGVVIVSACGLYFSITGQVEDNAKEIDNIKSMGDLNRTLSPLAADLSYIKDELEKLKNKKIDIPKVDLSGIDDCKNKLDALSSKISAFENRLAKLEKRNSGGSRF
jgi:vacuolar-type H+-ATPase subunit I/STV1